jgi:hypothetical protein
MDRTARRGDRINVVVFAANRVFRLLRAGTAPARSLSWPYS